MQIENMHEKNHKKILVFLDKFISIGKDKFSLLLQEYSYLQVNVLARSPKISDLINTNFF